MIKAPFIRPIKLKGGTFYTFTSAIEDFNGNFGTNDNNISFSKFALLNIPDLKKPLNGENNIQLNAVPGANDYYGSVIGTELNDAFAESFENYCLNLEAGFLLSDNYNVNALRTVSERIFFKWMKEIGALRFREASQDELNGEVYGSRFVEEDSSDSYQRVVEYVGDISVMNSVKNQHNSYLEVYTHIPSNHGNTPKILFNAIDDENYKPNQKIVNNPIDPLNDEVIFGRAYNDTHPAGLNFLSHYDSDSGFNDFWYFDTNTNQYVEYGDASGLFRWWYNLPQDSTFFTEPTAFNNALNDKFAIGTEDPNVGSNLQVVKFIRSRLDGISLEFNKDVYQGVNETLNELNISTSAKDFEFNAMLVYYDVESKSISEKVSNLFGVLFFDNVESLSTGGGAISRMQKFKPDNLIHSNGNSFGFKLNIKWGTSTTDTGFEVTINDYSTYSLQLYTDALNEMMNSSSLLQKNIELFNTVSDKINALEDKVINNDIDALRSDLNELKQAINDNNKVFLNSENLLELLSRNYEEIKNIYNGETSINMNYNLDVFKSGDGVKVTKSEDRIKINNINENFNISTNSILNIVSDFTNSTKEYSKEIDLVNFSNLIRITDGSLGNPYSLDKHLHLFIKDDKTSWKNGQTLRISFEHGLNLNNENGYFSFLIFTDYNNKLKDVNNYSKNILNISFDIFDKTPKPIIEITCIDSEALTFIYDVL